MSDIGTGTFLLEQRKGLRPSAREWGAHSLFGVRGSAGLSLPGK